MLLRLFTAVGRGAEVTFVRDVFEPSALTPVMELGVWLLRLVRMLAEGTVSPPLLFMGFFVFAFAFVFVFTFVFTFTFVFVFVFAFPLALIDDDGMCRSEQLLFGQHCVRFLVFWHFACICAL